MLAQSSSFDDGEGDEYSVMVLPFNSALLSCRYCRCCRVEETPGVTSSLADDTEPAVTYSRILTPLYSLVAFTAVLSASSRPSVMTSPSMVRVALAEDSSGVTSPPRLTMV